MQQLEEMMKQFQNKQNTPNQNPSPEKNKQEDNNSSGKKVITL